MERIHKLARDGEAHGSSEFSRLEREVRRDIATILEDLKDLDETIRTSRS
jgi:hypothetical protein